MKTKKCLMIASVSSMIGQFNMPNIDLLLSMGYMVAVAANFSFGNTFTDSDAEDLWNTLKSKNIEVHNIAFVRNIFDFKNITAYKQIKTLIDENGYSLIHCHSPIGGAVARLAARRHRKTGTQVIYTAHGFHFYRGAPLVNWLLYYPMEKWLSKYTDILITINNEDYNSAIQRLNAKNTYYIPGIGVDANRFANPAVDGKSKRGELGIPADATVIISIGELSKRKNHQVAIKAMSKIKSDKLYYIICGQGKLQKKLRDLCQKLKLENFVLFLGYRNDISDLLHMSDIFVFPSLQEGLPVALMEAMAAGLPCIVSKIRGNTDLVAHTKKVYICENNDEGEYIRAIENFMEEGARSGKMDAQTKNPLKKFDITYVLQQTKKIYSECEKGA